MGKLRMKDTPQDRHEQDREREREAHRKRKRRRREERERRYYQESKGKSGSSKSTSKSTYKSSTSPSSDDEGTRSSDLGEGRKSRGRRETSTASNTVDRDEHNSDDDSDAYVPPRPSKDRPYISYSFNDDDEESRLPLPQSRKRSPAITTIDDDATFHERLFDAMRDDEGPSYRDPFDGPSREAGYGLDYREALPDRRAFGRKTVIDDRYVDPVTGMVLNRVIFKDAMTDEDYAEHIRMGMYKRTHKEEVARQKRLAAERAAREAKTAEALRRMEEMELERLQKLEERARRKASAGASKTREAYQASWARLVDPKRQSEILTMADFPWPHMGESGGMNAQTVERFLTDHLFGYDADGNTNVEDVDQLEKRRKQAIRTAVLAYHPDRFERYVLRTKESQRDSVREMGLRVSQLLNEILNGMK